MGNSRWRLETSINLALLNAKEAHFAEDIEIIISDWGSEIPLSEVLCLVPDAQKRVKFVHIPTKIAQVKQKDSKFPEVIALNCAVRKANGEYIGRIDNDTIVGKEFFENFCNLVNNKDSLWFDPTKAFMFIERRSIPYRFSYRSFPINYVYNYIKYYGPKLKIETARTWGFPFWWSPVGIMLFHNKIWHESRGYDEKLIYWGWMEADLAIRLGKKHLLVDFKDLSGNFLYHLEHYPSLTAYNDRNGPATPRKKNNPKLYGLSYQANNENWGLHKENLKLNSYVLKEDSKYFNKNKLYTNKSSLTMWLSFFVCNITRKVDLLRLNLPGYTKNVFANLRVKIGKLKKLFSLC